MKKRHSETFQKSAIIHVIHILYSNVTKKKKERKKEMVIVVNLIWKSIIRQLFQEGRVLQIFSVDRFEGKPPKPENLPKLGIKFWQKFVKYFPNAGLVQTFNISDLTR